jgi:hypothetical protein
MAVSSNNKIFKEVQPHIVKKFFAYHKENPQVYKLVKKFANEAKKSGRNKFGIGMIWERMRWYFNVETNGDTFKLSNDHRSCYARLLMLEDPFFEKMFVRKTTTNYNR